MNPSTKNIKIFYNRDYIPFNLYINSIYDILSKNKFRVSIIHHLGELTPDTEILILFLNDVNEIHNVETGNIKVIFVHADYIINHSMSDQENMKSYINNKNSDNTYIWEYNNLNIKYYREHYTNQKWVFIPLLYNTYLEDMYNSTIVKRIPYTEKQIDILFMGSLQQPRRRHIIDTLKSKYENKYNIVVLDWCWNDIHCYINTIENSKMVLNIFSNKNNRPFDYYRLALLYSNKVMVVNEAIEHYNPAIETNLIELKDNITNISYHSLETEIDQYLQKSAVEISEITENTYTIFKTHNMNDYVCQFLSNI